jgi:hypothetical protein
MKDLVMMMMIMYRGAASVLEISIGKLSIRNWGFVGL